LSESEGPLMTSLRVEGGHVISVARGGGKTGEALSGKTTRRKGHRSPKKVGHLAGENVVLEKPRNTGYRTKRITLIKKRRGTLRQKPPRRTGNCFLGKYST